MTIEQIKYALHTAMLQAQILDRQGEATAAAGVSAAIWEFAEALRGSVDMTEFIAECAEG